ncbi:MAG: 4-(cytidine 5'-diphospho)-2-C-methyl-D-erythritol kinase [Allosphingosinicella sp.]
MRQTAYAKLNLALHVRAREPDGYHRIETAFAFAEQGDVLSVVEGEGIGLRVTGPFARSLADEEDNIVLAAARSVRERFGAKQGAALTLDKRLPVASGIGGGSADAAATIRLLLDWWRLRPPEAEVERLARGLGADVPACLHSRTARGEGRGDLLRPADYGVGGLPLLMVNPGLPLSTRSVFERWDGRDGGPLGEPRAGRNDLEAPARALVPEIGEMLEAFESLGTAELIRMSGSGATCFALFREEADRDAASRLFGERHPGWWRMSSRLR